MQPARLSPMSALAAACAGAGAWCTLGTLTVTEGGVHASRIGLLPPAWWLIALVAAAVALARVARVSADRARPLFFGAVLILPWLPVPVLAPMLVWAGPVAWLVWAAIGSAMLSAGHATPGRWQRWRAALTNPARAPWVAFVCAAIVYGSAAWRLAPLVPGGDEPHYLVIAQSIWRDGDLRIENNHQRGDYREYFDGALRPDYLKRGQDRQIYSIHLPGVPAIIAPVFAAGGYGLVVAFLALASAAATAVAWRTAFLLTGSAAAAWFGWAAVALTAPFLLLSFTVYPDGPGAVVVMLAFAAIARLHTRPTRPAWWWLAVGVLPALLPWFHPRFAVLAAALGLVLAGRALRGARPAAALASFTALPAASAIAWFGYYYSIYGRFNPSVAYGHYTQMSIGRIPTGVLGLLFDQEYGLIVHAPVFAIGAAGLAALFRSHRRIAVEWSVIVMPYALVTAMYHMWWGGFSSPARFIGATLLLFSIPIAAAWMEARQAATRSLQVIGLGVSAAIAAMLLLVERGAFVFNVRDTAAPWLVWAGQVADVAHGVPSLFRQGPWAAFADAGVWAAVLCAGWLLARLAARTGQLQRGSAALVVLCALGVAVGASFAIIWRMQGVSGIVATAGQLRALDAVGSARAAHGVTFDPHAVVSPQRALEGMRIGLEPVNGAPEGAWLWLPYLPAGRYRLWIEASAPGSTFDVALLAGRSDGPLDSWRVETAASGASSREVFLPVGVNALMVRGPAEARGNGRTCWLQPSAEVDRVEPTSPRRATAARRLGGVAVFALGNAVYLEPGGLWTAAGRTAEIVVLAKPDQERVEFTLRGGPVATPVEITSGVFTLQATLAPGESRDLVIPVRRGAAALVRIRAELGFRPASVDSSSTDTRLLGVRLEPTSK